MMRDANKKVGPACIQKVGKYPQTAKLLLLISFRKAAAQKRRSSFYGAIIYYLCYSIGKKLESGQKNLDLCFYCELCWINGVFIVNYSMRELFRHYFRGKYFFCELKTRQCRYAAEEKRSTRNPLFQLHFYFQVMVRGKS